MKFSTPRLTGNTALLSVAIAIFATLIYLPAHPFVDEYIHWPTAQQFAHGKWRLDPSVSTWPTMNAIVGWTTAAIGQSAHIVAGRMVIVAFSLLALLGFHRVAQAFDTNSASLRTAQFFLSPIVLPFCALIYTDLPALSCLLWATVGALRRQTWLVIGAGFLACAFRQSDIVWFAALVAMYGWLKWRAGEEIKAVHVLAVIGVVVAWLTVVGLQGGVASGLYTKVDHPGGLKGIPNIWFAAVVAAIVYLPYFGARLAADKVPLPLWKMLLIALFVALTFHVTHRLNLIEINYFLRNNLLHQTFVPAARAVFVIVASAASILIFRTRLARYEELRLPLLVFGVLSLLPFWLIEQRYYLPMYALFWAMRAPVNRRIEILQLVFGIACSVWMIVRIGLGFNFL